MSGVPCIKGMRIPVTTVVGMFAEGMTTAEITTASPSLLSIPVDEHLAASGLAADRRLFEAFEGRVTPS